MRRSVLTCVLAAGLGMAAVSDTATAQVFFQNQTNPYVRPPISPYLNLARTGNPAINYYGLTKQQVDVNRQLLNLQMQQQGLTSQLGAGAEEDGLASTNAITGHSTSYFNYGHYFGQAGGNVRPAQPPLAVPKKY